MKTLVSAWQDRFEKPDAGVILRVFDGRLAETTFTANEFKSAVERIAGGLKDAGVRKRSCFPVADVGTRNDGVFLGVRFNRRGPMPAFHRLRRGRAERAFPFRRGGRPDSGSGFSRAVNGDRRQSRAADGPADGGYQGGHARIRI